MAPTTNSPRLTVNALAEMLRMPAYDQVRVLYDQKYPKQQPQSFRTPYYQAAVTGIREYFRSGNDSRSITSARNDLQSIGNATRRAQNLRVLDQFENSSLVKQELQLLPNTRYSAKIDSLEIRLSPDIQAMEDGELAMLYFNCRTAPVPDDIASFTVEIANWVLEQNEVEIEFDHVQVIDLITGQTHKRKRGRPTTLKTLKSNARIIATLWPSV
jgi:hypothetical protein